MQISGSAQFSKAALQTILLQIPVPFNEIIVVDLREKSHGFMEGTAVSWYAVRDWINISKNPADIESEQNRLLSNLRNLPEIIISKVIKKNRAGEIVQFVEKVSHICHVCSEYELTKEMGIQYERIYATDHLPAVQGSQGAGPKA